MLEKVYARRAKADVEITAKAIDRASWVSYHCLAGGGLVHSVGLRFERQEGGPDTGLEPEPWSSEFRAFLAPKCGSVFGAGKWFRKLNHVSRT